MNAVTHPVEQAFLFVFVDDRYREDAGLSGQHSGFGWSISGSLEIFLHHDIFTSDIVVDFSNKNSYLNRYLNQQWHTTMIIYSETCCDI